MKMPNTNLRLEIATTRQRGWSNHRPRRASVAAVPQPSMRRVLSPAVILGKTL
jgi:hypothetical protein